MDKRSCRVIAVAALVFPSPALAGGGARVLVTLDPATVMAPLLGIAAMALLLSVLAALGVAALRRRPGLVGRAALVIGTIAVLGGGAAWVEGAAVLITPIDGNDCTQRTVKDILAIQPIGLRNDCDHSMHIVDLELVDCPPNDIVNPVVPACNAGDSLAPDEICNLLFAIEADGRGHHFDRQSKNSSRGRHRRSGRVWLVPVSPGVLWVRHVGLAGRFSGADRDAGVDGASCRSGSEGAIG